MPKERTSGKLKARRYASEDKAAVVRMVRTRRAELDTDQGRARWSRVKELVREIRELKRSNEILKRATSLFSAELDHLTRTVGFIDTYSGESAVEPISAVWRSLTSTTRISAVRTVRLPADVASMRWAWICGAIRWRKTFHRVAWCAAKVSRSCGLNARQIWFSLGQQPVGALAATVNLSPDHRTDPVAPQRDSATVQRDGSSDRAKKW